MLLGLTFSWWVLLVGTFGQSFTSWHGFFCRVVLQMSVYCIHYIAPYRTQVFAIGLEKVPSSYNFRRFFFSFVHNRVLNFYEKNTANRNSKRNFENPKVYENFALAKKEKLYGEGRWNWIINLACPPLQILRIFLPNRYLMPKTRRLVFPFDTFIKSWKIIPNWLQKYEYSFLSVENPLWTLENLRTENDEERRFCFAFLSYCLLGEYLDPTWCILKNSSSTCNSGQICWALASLTKFDRSKWIWIVSGLSQWVF